MPVERLNPFQLKKKVRFSRSDTVYNPDYKKPSKKWKIETLPKLPPAPETPEGVELMTLRYRNCILEYHKLHRPPNRSTDNTVGTIAVWKEGDNMFVRVRDKVCWRKPESGQTVCKHPLYSMLVLGINNHGDPRWMSYSALTPKVRKHLCEFLKTNKDDSFRVNKKADVKNRKDDSVNHKSEVKIKAEDIGPHPK